MIFNENFSKIRTSLLIALADSAIQSYWLNIFICMCIMGKDELTSMIELPASVFICLVIYILLYHKYGSKPEIFIYSVGFSSCCYVSYFFGERLAEILSRSSYTMSPYTVFIHMLLFILVFYSYAALCECKGIPDRITSFLLAVTGVFFVGSALSELVLSEFLSMAFPLAAICLPLFGTYFICCLVLKKAILSVRIFSWSMFWTSLCIFAVSIYHAIGAHPF